MPDGWNSRLIGGAIEFVVVCRWLVMTVQLKDNWFWLDVVNKRLGHRHSHLADISHITTCVKAKSACVKNGKKESCHFRMASLVRASLEFKKKHFAVFGRRLILPFIRFVNGESFFAIILFSTRDYITVVFKILLLYFNTKCTQLVQIASRIIHQYAVKCCPRGQHWAANIEVDTAFLFKWVLLNFFCFSFEVQQSSDWRHRSSLKFFCPRFIKCFPRPPASRKHFTNRWQKINDDLDASHYLYDVASKSDI